MTEKMLGRDLALIFCLALSIVPEIGAFHALPVRVRPCIRRSLQICAASKATPKADEPRFLGSRRLYRIFKKPKEDAQVPSSPVSVSDVSSTLRKIVAVAELQRDIQSEQIRLSELKREQAANAAAESTTKANPQADEPKREQTIQGGDDLATKMATLKDAVEQSIEVNARPEDCFKVAADFEKYPEWAGSVQYVKVLEMTPGGLGKKAEYKVGAFGTSLSYTLQYNFDAPRRMEWRAIAGSVKELLGSYEFSPAGDGRTRVVYKLAIDPGFPLPAMLKQPATRLIVSTALNELKRHTEKLSAAK